MCNRIVCDVITYHRWYNINNNLKAKVMVVGGGDRTNTSKRVFLGKLTEDEMMLHGTNYNQRHNHEKTMLHLRFKTTYM